jgi:hypothetical protein
MFGLLRRKKEQEQRDPVLSVAAVPEPEQKQKAFCIALSWKGLFGLLLIFFILQIWMFLLGMWAAQSIVFPTAASALPAPVKQERQDLLQEQHQEQPASTDAEQDNSPSR